MISSQSRSRFSRNYWYEETGQVTSTEMLFRVYSRFVPNLTRQDGSAIDRLLATRFSSGRTSSDGKSGDGAHPPSQPPPARIDRQPALA
jgi:hypothetical protein